MKYVKHIHEAMEYFSLSASDKDYSSILQNMNTLQDGECVCCNHCQPCPQGLDIAEILKLTDMFDIDKSTEILSRYQKLTLNAEHSSECHSCEKRCISSVQIVEKMKHAHEIFK